MSCSSGRQFRTLIQTNPPLQIMGVINAYAAMLAETAGCQAIYLSGAGVANASYGLPDLGMTTLTEVMEDVRRIREACALPLLVDVDTGWGSPLNIARTVKLMEAAGVAAVHIEDQVVTKRCGHRPKKAIVSLQTMGDRIKAAVDARKEAAFVIMARTDAYAVEGLNAAIERAHYCMELGADMLFPEAMLSLDDYNKFCGAIKIPVLANITEFGKTPLFTKEELKSVGVQLILYPLSAFRAMAFAARDVYQTILREGTQASLLLKMQTREELYQVLNYHNYERKIDNLIEENNHEQ